MSDNRRKTCDIWCSRTSPSHISRLSIADLHRVATQEENLARLSHSSLARFLRQNALKPWRYRYWLFPRDPEFVSRACVVLDLYAGVWEGQRLGVDEYVLSADKKTIQVLARCAPTPRRAATPTLRRSTRSRSDCCGILRAAWTYSTRPAHLLGKVTGMRQRSWRARAATVAAACAAPCTCTTAA